MKRLLTFIFLLLIIVIGLSFTVLNAGEVELNYYFGTISLPLAAVVLAAIMLGSLLGILATLSLVFAVKAKNVTLQRKVGLIEKEIKNLREIPIKDKH
jgi:putative membrane protein